MLAADRPASALARRLHLQQQRPQTVALLRGSAARVAPAEDRGPAGEGLDGRGEGRRRRRRRLQQLRGQRLGSGRERPPATAQPPVHCPAPHCARAVRRAAASVEREAADATGALTTKSRHLDFELRRRVDAAV